MADAEKEPAIPGQWLTVWRRCLRAMKEQGSWSGELRQLLDAYVEALMDAEDARDDGRGAEVDRCVKRASALADQLALTPRGRKAAGLIGDSDEKPANPFEGLRAVS